MIRWPRKFILEQKHGRPETTGRGGATYVRGLEARSGDLVALGEKESSVGDFPFPASVGRVASDLEWKCLESK